jgi:predicted naringenin-chalcone synthase
MDLTRNDGADLRRGVPIDQIALWAVHAGGRSVLDAVATGYGLPDGALSHSRAILHDVGNVSSATIMFVLAHMLSEGATGPGMGLAFGPGITAEAFGFTALG